MKRQSPDTDVKMEAAWIALLRRATPAQKFAQVRSLSATTLSLSRRAIVRRHGDLTDVQLRGLFVYYQYGPELADRFQRYESQRSHAES
ncbi:MAG: hypothetical protein FJ280_30475 [Planctomycetes bacterium]|nr:hypothetical protein [Planctomycetota bacterium]